MVCSFPKRWALQWKPREGEGFPRPCHLPGALVLALGRLHSHLSQLVWMNHRKKTLKFSFQTDHWVGRTPYGDRQVLVLTEGAYQKCVAGTLLVVNMAINWSWNCTLNERGAYQEVNKYLSILKNTLWTYMALLRLTRVSDGSRRACAECPWKQLCSSPGHLGDLGAQKPPSQQAHNSEASINWKRF